MTLPALLLAAALAAPPQTLRVDWFHTGDHAREFFALDGQVLEPLPWPGNPARPLDDLDLGGWRVEVRDAASGTLLHSRGFDTVFSEWRSTSEATRGLRTFHESARFPDPGRPYTFTLLQRTAAGAFEERWKLELDPRSRSVRTAHPPAPGKVLPLHRGGPSERALDLLLLGDGYTDKEAATFEKDARRMLEALFSRSPFKERKADVNAWGLRLRAAAPGISRPSTGIARFSPLGTTYDAFGSERYVLAFDNRGLRDAAMYAPYDAVVILAHADTYGGGGIYNLYSTVAAGSAWAPYVFVHELGHHLAGLADEYFAADPLYVPDPNRPEPWERNVTTRPTEPKWKHLLTPGVPLPTPWGLEGFAARARTYEETRKRLRAEARPESEMDAHFRDQQGLEEKAFAAEPWSRAVGAFEGAHYSPAGYYRPELDCVMFSRSIPFCRVCHAALDEVLDFHTRP